MSEEQSYKCENCNKICKESELKRIKIHGVGFYGLEVEIHCPFCNSRNIDKTDI
jgi:DNA-directed RNA polymerase subunit RPC12/RpoP